MKGVPVVPLVALAVLLPSGTAIAQSGYHTDFDFPGQGVDWYGSSIPHDPKRDYRPFFLDTFSDGDDFGLGYEISTDLYGFGPPVLLTNTRTSEYRFRFGSLGSVFAPECMNNGECSDGIFCNGAELCLTGTCQSGSPPSCDDADACTIDSCDPGLDQCVHPNGPPPDEIEGLNMKFTDPDFLIAGLNWDPQVLVDTYNVYRGEKSDLGGLSCFRSGIGGTSTVDDGMEAPGGIYIFLVTGFGCGAETSAGTRSDGTPRILPMPCP